MQFLDEGSLLQAIAGGLPFKATLDDNSLTVEVKEYRPIIATAIHHGHNMPGRLEEYCRLSDAERLQEEDPCTGDFIADLPITVTALDSRYAYDLNRTPENPIYDMAWGKIVWKKPLPASQRKQCIVRHHRYYRILHALISKTIELVNGCAILDLHSYCYQIREYPLAPVFNTGTAQIDMVRWAPLVSTFETALDQIPLPGVATSVGRDVVFQGRAWQAGYVKQHFPHIPVIPTEIKKIYMDENSGELYRDRIRALAAGISTACQRLEESYLKLIATAEKTG
jgi:hypothetical protein